MALRGFLGNFATDYSLCGATPQPRFLLGSYLPDALPPLVASLVKQGTELVSGVVKLRRTALLGTTLDPGGGCSRKNEQINGGLAEGEKFLILNMQFSGKRKRRSFNRKGAKGIKGRE